jgi:type IV secretory pathway VirB3-like protein
MYHAHNSVCIFLRLYLFPEILPISIRTLYYLYLYVRSTTYIYTYALLPIYIRTLYYLCIIPFRHSIPFYLFFIVRLSIFHLLHLNLFQTQHSISGNFFFGESKSIKLIKLKKRPVKFIR